MRKIIYILILIMFISMPVAAETVIYDNITTSQYKCFQIDDSSNIKYLNDYKYKILINDSYLNEYVKGDCIQFPDHSNVTILFIPPIKTDMSDVYSTYVKPTLVTGLGFFASWGLLIVLILIIIYKIYVDWLRRR